MTIPNQRRRMAMEARGAEEHTGIQPDDDRVAKAIQAAAMAVGREIAEYRLMNAAGTTDALNLENLEIRVQNAVVRAATAELNAVGSA